MCTHKELDYHDKKHLYDSRMSQLSAHAIYESARYMNGKRLVRKSDLKKMFPLLYPESDKVLTEEETLNLLMKLM